MGMYAKTGKLDLARIFSVSYRIMLGDALYRFVYKNGLVLRPASRREYN
jgi:hypothetical protein